MRLYKVEFFRKTWFFTIIFTWNTWTFNYTVCPIAMLQMSNAQILLSITMKYISLLHDFLLFFFCLLFNIDPNFYRIKQTEHTPISHAQKQKQMTTKKRNKNRTVIRKAEVLYDLLKCETLNREYISNFFFYFSSII